MKTVAVSGYFLIYHAGHQEYLRKASLLGGRLVVILNNDHQQKLKYGRVIIPYEQRKSVLESVRYVDEVIKSIDKTECVCETLEILKPDIFAKGGDRRKGNIPEKRLCEDLGIKIVDGLGKKIQSSSKLLCQKFQ